MFVVIPAGTVCRYVGPAQAHAFIPRLGQTCILLSDIHEHATALTAVLIKFLGEEERHMTTLEKLSVTLKDVDIPQVLANKRRVEQHRAKVARKEENAKKDFYRRHFENAVKDCFSDADFAYDAVAGAYENFAVQCRWLGYVLATETLKNRSVGTFIIARMVDGRPTFIQTTPDVVFRPYVHTTYAKAIAETDRLREVRPDDTFVVYNSITTRSPKKAKAPQ